MHVQPTKFESLLEDVPDAWVGVDQADVTRFVSRQTESLFGNAAGGLRWCAP
jgi:hypothetical protein